MSEYLDPTGQTSFGIGICDRCKLKYLIVELKSDPNSPGLKVCKGCRDQFDPYRLPARQTERISLEFTRPDSDLTGHRLPVIRALSTEQNSFGQTVNDILFTEDGKALQTEGIE